MTKAASQQQGFALFAVVVMLLLMTAAVAVALDDAVASLQASSGARTAEMVRGGMGAGLDQALILIQDTDAVEFRDVNPAWDLDQTQTPTFMGNINYPPAGGTVVQEYLITVGAVPVQITRAPQGEDASKSYGAVIEVQVQVEVDSTVNASAPPSGQRVTVGVLVPRQRSGSS